MENSYKANGNGPTENGYSVARHSYQPSLKGSLPWLDIWGTKKGNHLYISMTKGKVIESNIKDITPSLTLGLI